MDDVISRQAAIDAFERYKIDDPMYGLDENEQGWNEGLDTAVELLKELPPAQQWIPCTERLPEKDGTYLCTVASLIKPKESYVQMIEYGVPTLPMNGVPDGRGWFYITDDGDYLCGGILAWRELPEPWEGEDDD